MTFISSVKGTSFQPSSLPAIKTFKPNSTDYDRSIIQNNLNTEASFDYQSLKGVDMSNSRVEVDLNACDLRNGNFQGTIFTKPLRSVQFNDSDMQGVTFQRDVRNLSLRGCNLTFSTAKSIQFLGQCGDILGADFTGSNLEGSRFAPVNFEDSSATTQPQKTIFNRCNLHSSIFDGCNLLRVDMKENDLRTTSFKGSILTAGNLQGSQLPKNITEQADHIIGPPLNQENWHVWKKVLEHMTPPDGSRKVFSTHIEDSDNPKLNHKHILTLNRNSNSFVVHYSDNESAIVAPPSLGTQSPGPRPNVNICWEIPFETGIPVVVKEYTNYYGRVPNENLIERALSRGLLEAFTSKSTSTKILIKNNEDNIVSRRLNDSGKIKPTEEENKMIHLLMTGMEPQEE
ncbi:MAG TPA: pentapeptide repeat-containing protein [Vampirovibrionales bacterium]